MAESLNVSGSVNMPFNLEAEQSVLGSILIKPECIEEVIEHVNADSFYLPQHNAIFSSMMVMYSNSKAIDPVIIADALAKDGKYDEAGGRDYLLQLAQSVPSTANVVYYAKIVKEQYYLRQLVSLSSKIIEDATSGEADATSILENAEQSIYNIRQGRESNGPAKVSEVIVNDVYTKLAQITGVVMNQNQQRRNAGAFLGFLLSGHFTDELWIILLSALILGLILGFLATRLILLSTFFVVLILVSVFSCGLLVSFVPSLSNVTAGIISLILGIVAGVICIKLQKPIIILVTAFCGALGTVQILFQLLKFEQITIFYGAFLSLAMIGSIVQFLSTRRDA